MWNLTSRPRAVSPHRWTNHSIDVFQDMNSSLIVMPERLDQDAQMGILRTRTVIPSVNSSAPKPPKKRFLEAAAAYQLEEQEKLKQQQQQMQLQLQQQEQTIKGKTTGEDNSALMQLAEMCVYYQASSADGNPNESWAPVTGVWKCVNRRIGVEEDPIDPAVYPSITMGRVVQGEISPKAATPFWGWTHRATIGHSGQDLSDVRHETEEDENEEPLDLSGEETIRTNQQELIDHLVEKLCAQPVSSRFSSLVQKKLSLLEMPVASAAQPAVSLQHSSSEVSSSCIDSKDSVTVATKADVRRDLPLKKRDASSLQQQQQAGCDQSGSGNFCDSSTTIKRESSTEVVTSTNNNSKKPAPRSCKGKRYLEFMYEGRTRLKRTESNEQIELDQQQQTPTCDQSSSPKKRQQRHAKNAESEKPASGVLRGRNAKLRKLS